MNFIIEHPWISLVIGLLILSAMELLKEFIIDLVHGPAEQNKQSIFRKQTPSICPRDADYRKATETLEAISKMKQGWDGYDAPPIDEESIKQCVTLLSLLYMKGPYIIGWDVSPTGRKTVQIEKTTNNGYYEIEFMTDGKMHAFSIVPSRNGVATERIYDSYASTIQWIISVVA
jgi:hypothetical protein